MIRLQILILVVAIGLAGCTTVRETEPTQTAREQLLLSAAADHASSRIQSDLAPNSRIFLDTSYVSTSEGDEYRNRYAVNAIRAALLRDGYGLADDRADADVIATVSTGALSINRRERLLGLPSTTLPIPLAGPFETPELALWKKSKRTGVAKFLVAFYDARTGAALDVNDPVLGFSHYDRSSVLFYGWTDSDLMPKEAQQRHDGTAE